MSCFMEKTCFLHIWAASWENQQSAYAKTKTQISFAVTAKLISAFVFATWMVQSLYFLNPKFRASIARFVSDLVRNHIVGFLMTRLIWGKTKVQISWFIRGGWWPSSACSFFTRLNFKIVTVKFLNFPHQKTLQLWT